MFKDLFGFLQSFKPGETPLDEFLSRPDQKAIKTFYEGLERFPFFDEISRSLPKMGNSPGEMLYSFVSENGFMDSRVYRYGKWLPQAFFQGIPLR